MGNCLATVSPPEWLDDVRKANEDTLLGLSDHLPREAAEALLDVATGAIPQSAVPVPQELRIRPVNPWGGFCDSTNSVSAYTPMQADTIFALEF